MLVATFPAKRRTRYGARTTRGPRASFDPIGRARRVPGGFRFSGRHEFASGIDHSQWLICGGFIVEGRPRRSAFLPRADLRGDGDRRLGHPGLEGTGSKSFVAEDLFLPAHRLLDGELARIGEGPGTAVNPAPISRTPRGGITSTGFASVSVGMARSVLNEWLLLTGPRKAKGVAVAHQPGSLFAAAEASAAGIDAAEALYQVDGARRHAQARGGRHARAAPSA